jgi:hypothetical protein
MALTIRERTRTGRGVGAVGTTSNPLPVEGLVGAAEPTVQNFKLRLGFEAIPSTQVLSFVLERPAELRVQRHSTDPYIVHVAVGLQGPDDNRGPGCRPLVQTQGGDSGWHQLEAGRWWLVVACGMPIDISLEINISLRAIPAALTLGPIAGILSSLAIGGRKPSFARTELAFPSLASAAVGGQAAMALPIEEPLAPVRPAPIPLAFPMDPDDPLLVTNGGARIDAGALQKAGLLPDGFDLWTLRPWRGGVVSGFPWLRDRRGHIHAFSPWPLLIVPLPGPLEPGDVTVAVDGIGQLLLRPDALGRGIGQGRFPANTPAPAGPVAFEVVLQGRAHLQGTWHSDGSSSSQDQLA